MPVSTEVAESKMSVLQRFPPEIVYTIVMGVLGEQLDSIVYGTPEQQQDVDDANPSLALLHLCHGFRVCTVEVLRHMWSPKRDGGSTHNFIPFLRHLRALSQAKQESELNALSANVPDGAAESPVYTIISQYLFSCRFFDAWASSVRDGRREVLARDAHRLEWSIVVEKFGSMPVWVRHNILGAVATAAIHRAMYNTKMLSLSLACVSISNHLANTEVDWTQLAFSRMLSDVYTDNGYTSGIIVCGNCQGAVERAAAVNINCRVPALSPEDIDLASGPAAYNAIAELQSKGGFDPAAAVKMRKALPAFAYLSKAEVMAGFPYSSPPQTPAAVEVSEDAVMSAGAVPVAGLTETMSAVDPAPTVVEAALV
ncbi:unnamed protein product [Peniophora sp. CBMAI 1063]|nr:unnamed protein product [Peniophora sp. CBMAI 1063]